MRMAATRVTGPWGTPSTCRCSGVPVRDVVIVGAGPVGLFLACELGLAGCDVLVLEREPEPRSPWKADPLGMPGLSAASVEAFHRRGMLDLERVPCSSGRTGWSPGSVIAPPIGRRSRALLAGGSVARGSKP